MANMTRRRKKQVRDWLMRQCAHQDERCFYCDCEMWVSNLGDDKLSAEQMMIRHSRATREHLTRQCDGGGDEPDNLVAACQRCNTNRGETPWEEYLDRKEAEARVNCPDPDSGYGDASCVHFVATETPEFRASDTYFTGESKTWRRRVRR